MIKLKVERKWRSKGTFWCLVRPRSLMNARLHDILRQHQPHWPHMRAASNFHPKIHPKSTETTHSMHLVTFASNFHPKIDPKSTDTIYLETRERIEERGQEHFSKTAPRRSQNVWSFARPHGFGLVTEKMFWAFVRTAWPAASKVPAGVVSGLRNCMNC